MSYGLKQADARVPFAGRTYSVYVHPSENTLLVQPSFADAFPMALANKESISATGARQILEQFLRGTSCTMTEPKFVSEATFESEYSCAPGFDLRATMRSQRAQLVKGSPLRGDR